MNSIEEVVAYLRDPERRGKPPTGADTVKGTLTAEKQRAVEIGDGARANRIWCLEQSLHVQDLYAQCFAELRQEEFGLAWRTLERTETAAEFLEPHEKEFWTSFRLDFIQVHVRRWQSLYPYTHFLSPEFLYKKKSCTICNAPVSIRHPCGHTVGQLYNGELSLRRVEDVAILGVSLVTNPVQKYSVVHPQGIDHDYAAPRYVIRRLQSPFHAWEPTFSRTRHPHARYAHVDPKEPCPCGGDQNYELCCLPESGVLRPHINVWFEVPPSAELMALEYSEPAPAAASSRQ